MPDVFFISDFHFNHNNVIKFTRLDGTLLRPGFTSIEHMNEHMVQCWNSVVKPGNKVYILGDFGDPQFANRLIGQKRLILGNHDVDVQHLVGRFKKIQAWRRWKEGDISFVLTHFPILMSEDPIEKRTIHFNVHGHIHDKIVMRGNQPDLRYINVSVEQLNYTPMHLDDLLKIMKHRM